MPSRRKDIAHLGEIPPQERGPWASFHLLILITLPTKGNMSAARWKKQGRFLFTPLLLPGLFSGEIRGD